MEVAVGGCNDLPAHAQQIGVGRVDRRRRFLSERQGSDRDAGGCAGTSLGASPEDAAAQHADR